MEKEVKIKTNSYKLNKLGYIAFLATGIVFLVLKDFSQASIFWGLALIFDPFNPSTPFQKRPTYQKIWLIVHLLIMLILIVLMLTGK